MLQNQALWLLTSLSYLLLIVLCGCQSDKKTEQNYERRPSAFANDQRIPDTPATSQLIDFSSSSPELARRVTRSELSPSAQQRFLKSFAQAPHSWLDLIFDRLNRDQLNESQAHAQCDLIMKLIPKASIIAAHDRDPFSVKEFPLWYHSNLKEYCQILRRLDREITRVEDENLTRRTNRQVLEQTARDQLMIMAREMIRRDDVSEGYWLLKGYLVNPGDRIYEISVPNLFESRSLVCTSSTDCVSMANIKSKVNGGLRDRVLLNSVTRYHSKGRIEMLVTYGRTETLYTRSGRRVEWAVMNEASHLPLLNAQRAYLEAKEASENADAALKRAPSETDLSEAYATRNKSLKLLAQSLSIYREARERLPRYIAHQDLWMRAEFHDLCDQLEWQGRGALKQRSTKKVYRASLKPLKSMLRGVKRIDCSLASYKRTALDQYMGTLKVTTFRKNRKPKGSALATIYEVHWDATFSDAGDMTLGRFEPRVVSQEPQVVQEPPYLSRKSIAKRYKLHRPKLNLKRDYEICASGINAFKSTRRRRVAGRITPQDYVLSVGKPRRGSVKVKLYGRRAVYLDKDQDCLKRERQDGNFRSMYTANYELEEVEVSDLPSSKISSETVKDAKLFLIEHKMGEKKRWSSGWILNGSNAGRRVFIKSEDLVPKKPKTPVGQPI